jgi:hypothetical protein
MDDALLRASTIESHVTKVAARGNQVDVLSALLDRVLSERSEDKLVFLINVRRCRVDGH